MAAYPMAAAAAAAAAGNTCLPQGAFCSIPWICPGQPLPERLMQPSLARRGEAGRLEEIVHVPGTSHQMLALHNSSVGPSPYFPLDSPSLMYSYYLGFGGADVRRKNATRESTSTLKAWLYEHRKNPYPTKGEKIMLAIITKMTLTQVSTWFANARRRLKKENKGEWGLKETNDPDEDDFDDDGAQCDEAGRRPMQETSASDSSSARGSPDLPLTLYSPSSSSFDEEKAFRVTPRQPTLHRSTAAAAAAATAATAAAVSASPAAPSAAEDDSQNSEFESKVTSDDVRTEGAENRSSRLGFDDDITSMLLSNASRSALPLESAAHPVHPSTTASSSSTLVDDRLTSGFSDVRPETLKRAPSEPLSSVATNPPSASTKRKLWSIDDIVSPAPPTDHTQNESSSVVTVSTRPGFESISSAPFKYSPYLVSAGRSLFGRSAVTSSALFPWITTSSAVVPRYGGGDVDRRMTSEGLMGGDVRAKTFDHRPTTHFNGVGFTLRKNTTECTTTTQLNNAVNPGFK